jgi:endogenous inhibitor of DNA gyrase (YacG/DUF329 family)
MLIGVRAVSPEKIGCGIGGSDNGEALTPICYRPLMEPRIVKCPQCKAEVAWTPESKWRPFCSERCKLIDLGAWASERYRIETPEVPVGNDAASDAPRRDP